MQIIITSAIMTVLVLLAPHIGFLGIGLLIMYAVYSLYSMLAMAILHLFMSRAHMLPTPLKTKATLMNMLGEFRTAYLNHTWLIVDILMDLTQVISLFYFEFFSMGVIIGVAHLLGYSVYFRLPSFFWSIENGQSR